MVELGSLHISLATVERPSEAIATGVVLFVCFLLNIY